MLVFPPDFGGGFVLGGGGLPAPPGFELPAVLEKELFSPRADSPDPAAVEFELNDCAEEKPVLARPLEANLSGDLVVDFAFRRKEFRG
jgi:hypothetical protein